MDFIISKLYYTTTTSIKRSRFSTLIKALMDLQDMQSSISRKAEMLSQLKELQEQPDLNPTDFFVSRVLKPRRRFTNDMVVSKRGLYVCVIHGTLYTPKASKEIFPCCPDCKKITTWELHDQPERMGMFRGR